MSLSHFFSPCPRGLEPILSAELEELGAQALVATQGGVGFTGPFDFCYRVNLESRIASRVLWQVGRGPYRREQDLYQAAYALPWREWFSVSRTIKVKVSAQHCPLKSLDFVTLRIKDAVCDKFSSAARARPSVDTGKPDIRIDVFLDEKDYILYLDTSGEPLFKRGLRQAHSEAPLRENLAAGILKLSGWTPARTLLDPMCGGGTLLMEAALMAHHIAPGLGRHFAFEKLHNFHQARWLELCAASKARQKSPGRTTIYGSDRDGSALKAAGTNLKSAGLAEAVALTQADVLDLTPPTDTGILVTNPPYGVRLGVEERLAEFYPRPGDALKQRFPGWSAYIFTADLRLPKLIGLAPSRRIPLFNGALECRLFEFRMVRGPMRQGKPEAQRPDPDGG